jgi:phosphohistidine phosphatase
MTTHLYLLRHGIADPRGTPDLPDDERPLTSKGEKRMRQVGRGLRALDIKLDRIVSSPLPRALRTAEIVADVLGLTRLLETTDALRADREPAAIREWLKTREEDRLMLVGHNPAFSDLVTLLVTGQPGAPLCELKKGGIAAFCAQPQGGMLLDWLAPPSLLRGLAD